MTDPFASQKKLYKHATPSQAHFYATDHGRRPSIRLILPCLGLEFSDGHYIGIDPEGVLCYNKFSDFPTEVWTRYEVSTTLHEGNVYVGIKFFAKNAKDVFAEFFALDHENVAQKSGIVAKVRDGKWTKSSFGEVEANVKKLKNQRTVMIVAQPIQWKAEFNVDDDLEQQEVDVHGRLRFKYLGNIHLGSFVRWNPDRLIFYESERNSRDYTAYFMPMNSLDTCMTSLGNVDKVFSDANWSSTGAGH